MTKRTFHFFALLVLSWCVMTFTHEMGHIVAGWCCGGTLKDADLWPWHLPYSIFDPNPLPLVTLWGGPMIGVLIPFLLASIVRREWTWFVANFCIIANGAYIAIGWVTGQRYLDTIQLLEHGAHPLTIALYCLVTVGFGYSAFRSSCISILSQPRGVNGTSKIH